MELNLENKKRKKNSKSRKYLNKKRSVQTSIPRYRDLK